MSTVEALLEERRGYVMRGLTNRVAQVDAEIKRLSGAVVADEPSIEDGRASDDVELAVKRGPGRRRKTIED